MQIPKLASLLEGYSWETLGSPGSKGSHASDDGVMAQNAVIAVSEGSE